MNEYGEDTTYRLAGDIAVLGYPKLSVKNMYAPLDGSTPTAYGIALVDRRALQPHLRESLRDAEDRRRGAELRPRARPPLGAPGNRAHRRHRSASRRRDHHRDAAAALSRREHSAPDSGEDSDLHAQGHAAHPGQRRRHARQDASRHRTDEPSPRPGLDHRAAQQRAHQLAGLRLAAGGQSRKPWWTTR